MDFPFPQRAFADGGMEDLLTRAMTNEYHPVDVALPQLHKALGNFNSYEGIGLGNIVVLGGAPKSMKTTTALWWMRRADKTPGVKPVLISYEMKPLELRLRLAQGFFDIPRHDFVPRRLTGQTIMELLRYYEENPPDFDPDFVRMRDTNLNYFMDYLEHLRSMGYNWFIFDNVQKLTVSGVNDSHWETKVRQIMYRLEDWVMSRGDEPVTVVPLSQINRAASANRYDSPTKHDLLGGTAIESQATQIIMIDHTRQAWSPLDNSTRGFMMVEGNRDGPQYFQVPYLFNWDSMTMRQGYPDEEHDWPKRPNSGES